MSLAALPFLIFHYAIWHYTEAVREILVFWRNLIWFAWHFFSVPLLFKTLLSPWKRIREKQPVGLDLEAIGSAIVVNLIMRIVGIMLRMALITFGLFTIGVFALTGGAFLLLWLLLPLLIPGLVSVGVALMFS